jgi:lipooligosaccharide transport system permease protein
MATRYVVEANARSYRRVWKGSAVTSFVNPVLFLLAMGMGMGSLVDKGSLGQGFSHIDYVEFLAPGLLAATAMQTGAGEGSWPVMAGIKWIKTYHAALATPVGIVDLVAGNLLWAAVRVLMSSLAFVIVMIALGGVGVVHGLEAIPAAVLTGMAFAAPITAYTAVAKDETRLSTLFRFAIIPMFLFSGTFFPVELLPNWLEPVAQVTPLWHGVELARASALGLHADMVAWHVGYLVAWVAVGWSVAVVTFRRRLVQ